MDKFTVISFFAGCGGSSTGYKMAGGRVLCVNEFMPEARKIYKANHPNTPIIDKDIRNVSILDIQDACGIKPRELDILDGSPPCSAFSIAGARERNWGKVVNYSSTKQRVDDLFYEYARMVRTLLPKVFVAENSDGLIKGGARKQMKKFLEVLEDCGYVVDFQILNAMNYGVPQERKRVFIAGVRKDLEKYPVFPAPSMTIKTTKEAIGHLVNSGTDDTCSTNSRRFELMKKYFPGGTDNNRIKEVKAMLDEKIYEQTFRRDKWKEPFYTIKQHHTRPFHPIVDRTLSVEEAKILQGFPTDYVFNSSPNKNWEFIGRAVPPPLIKELATCIDNNILRNIPHHPHLVAGLGILKEE